MEHSRNPFNPLRRGARQARAAVATLRVLWFALGGTVGAVFYFSSATIYLKEKPVPGDRTLIAGTTRDFLQVEAYQVESEGVLRRIGRTGEGGGGTKKRGQIPHPLLMGSSGGPKGAGQPVTLA